MVRFYLIITIAVLIFLFIAVTYLFKNYTKCPPGHVLIIFNNKTDIYGNNLKFVFSGGAFVLPIFGSYQLFNLAPWPTEINMEKLATSDQHIVHIILKINVAISNQEIHLRNAAERLSGLSQEQIKTLAADLISGQIRYFFLNMKSLELKQTTEFRTKISEQIENELNKIGLILISTDIKHLEIQNFKNN
ncbi:MAG: SPFH domain-containing protein [Bacteroidales bacterium]|nr:SPFH domain-containing protein [Bacteroidales bacterium]